MSVSLSREVIIRIPVSLLQLNSLLFYCIKVDYIKALLKPQRFHLRTLDQRFVHSFLTDGLPHVFPLHRLGCWVRQPFKNRNTHKARGYQSCSPLNCNKSAVAFWVHRFHAAPGQWITFCFHFQLTKTKHLWCKMHCRIFGLAVGCWQLCYHCWATSGRTFMFSQKREGGFIRTRGCLWTLSEGFEAWRCPLFVVRSPGWSLFSWIKTAQLWMGAESFKTNPSWNRKEDLLFQNKSN